MPQRVGPFTLGEIATALSRLPGREEPDRDEGFRIFDRLMMWYERGEFSDEEVVVLVIKEPGGERQLQNLRQTIDEGRLQSDDVEGVARRGGIMLTYGAAKRFVEASTVNAAPRVLDEWFSPPRAVSRRDAKRRTRTKPGPKPRLLDKMIQSMLDDLQSGRRSEQELANDKLSSLAALYDCSPNWAGYARRAALDHWRESHPSMIRDRTVIISEH